MPMKCRPPLTPPVGGGTKQLKLWLKSLQTRSTLLIIITAAVLMELMSVVQNWYAAKGIREEVQHRAESELRAKSLEIRTVMVGVEMATKNMRWAVEERLSSADGMYDLARHLVENTEMMVGCALAFEPNFYPEKGQLYEPYAFRNSQGTMELRQIASSSHNYLDSEWYRMGSGREDGYWSEPYYDNSGAKMMLCSYILPFHSPSGEVAGVICADVSLEWLSDVINARQIYPSSYNLMISRTGQMMVCPEESLVLRRSIQEMTREIKDTSVNTINRGMMAGGTGHATVYDNGSKNYVFYAPVEGGMGWSMAVVCSDKEVFEDLRKVSGGLTLMMLAGLALMAFIITRVVRGFKRLQESHAENERIGSELHIASSIQMGMLPKTFPPYPERDDVEIYGSLVPAKEVGGDLYDFYIRDEKLFFCIGDVSGKGVPASLVMAVTRSMFRTVSAHESAPDRIVQLLNESMSDMNDTNMFVTLFVGVLDLPTGRLRYCNAGHDAPLMIESGATKEQRGATRMLEVDSNIPVGVMGDWKYTQQEGLMRPYTTIFLYTDGLTEAENADHAQFGEENVMKTALAAASAEPTVLLQAMTERVGAFVDGAEQSDDLTMLAIQYTKEQRDVRLLRSLTLENDVQAVPRLSAFVDEVCAAMEMDEMETMQMNLAIEEAVVNVMKYAYLPGTKGEVNIEAQANDVRLKFTISDTGVPFDPTVRAEVDTSLPLEERPIGGLGIHLVRSIMDSINYERVEGKNVLTLRKKLEVRSEK